MHSIARTIQAVRRFTDDAPLHQPEVPGPGPNRHAARSIPLTLCSLRERISLLSEIRLRCQVRLGAWGAFAGATRLQGCRLLTGGDLSLLGDAFCVLLRQGEIGAVRVVYREQNEQHLTVRVEDRTGALIVRIAGWPDQWEEAVWSDVMGNPCYTGEDCASECP